MGTSAEVPFHPEHPYEPPYDRDAYKRIAALEAELEASKGRERLWQGRSNVMREEMQKSEAANTRLKEALANIAGVAAARSADPSLPGEARNSFNWIDEHARGALEHADGA